MNDQVYKPALDAVRETLRIFWLERFAYLLGSGVAFALVIYMAFQRVVLGDFAQAGGLLVSGGLFAVTGGRMLIFLRPTYELMNELIRKTNGLGTGSGK